MNGERECPRCHRPIRPHITGPSMQHPGGETVVTTFGGDEHCIACEFAADEFSEVHHEVLA